ncbi:hypothetical protein IAI18_15075 [Acetobacteraceae bacterium H6797]|nr:hypothetical protein [Acetobacteraceae bacterium H6797]
MMQALLTAGLRLAEALRAENEALSALDMARAAAVTPGKIQASDAFAAAFAASKRQGVKAEGPEKEIADQLAQRLAKLGEENRRLLERAISLQSRVIETIAGAALPASTPATYGAAGLRARAPHATALALSARA